MNDIGAAIFPFLFLAFAAGVVGVAIWQIKRAQETFLKSLDGDRDVEATAAGPGYMVNVATRPPHRRVTLSTTPNGGKQPWFDVTASRASFVERTTLHITREGVVGSVRESLGLHDIHVGDPQFDDELCVRGSDETVVRAIFADEEVRHATRRLFNTADASHVDIGAAGCRIRFQRRTGEGAEAARRVVLEAAALLAILEKRGSVPALPAHDETGLTVDVGGVGAGSGTPVVIPLGDKR